MQGATVSADAPPLLRLTGITKSYGAFRVLDGVDFDLRSGEVHALLGENGAGKSTMIAVITGNCAFEAGEYECLGRPAAGMTPQRLRALGIAAVFQEFSLLPDLTVEENIFLGREKRRGPMLDRATMRAEATALLAELHFDIPVTLAVSVLSRAEQQMVEIAKALLVPTPVLLLDEPTASLTDADANKLFTVVRRLQTRGVGIIYVSHRMREIHLLADRITVLRNGQRIATVAAGDIDEAALVAMMAGRPSAGLYPRIRHAPGPERLTVRGLAGGEGVVRDVSLSVRAGEIVGLAGLVGCGKSEVGRAVFGLLPISAGTVTVAGHLVPTPSPRAMLRRGVCYVPADRTREGLALNRPVRENATIASLDTLAIGGGGWLHPAAERRLGGAALEQVGVRPLAPAGLVLTLSGGNRQKVMLARSLTRQISVFLFDEPTVGIDVGAKAEIYAWLGRLVEQGAAVLLISSEMPEILHLSNRVYVMHQGRTVRELDGAEVTEKAILSYFFGTSPDAAVAQPAEATG